MLANSAAEITSLDLNAYYALIKDLMSPNNDVRNSAESKLDSIKYEILMPVIIQFFESVTVNNETLIDQYKIFSCTLLKNRLPSKSTHDTESSSIIPELYSRYLDIIQSVSAIPVKTMITVFKLFDILIDNIHSSIINVSDDIQKAFFNKTIEKLQIINNPIDPLIGIAILANTSGLWSDLSISQKMLMPHVNKFFEQFGQKMIDIGTSDDQNIKTAANNFIKYSSSFISRSESVQGLEQNVKIVVEVSYHFIVNVKLESISGSIIDHLQEIAQVRPRLFKPYIDKILDLIIYIMDTYSKDNEANLEYQQIKVSAMNFLCILFVDMSNIMMKFQDKLKVFILHVIDCMAIPDEDDDNFDTVDDDAENQNLDHISKQSEIVFDKMSVKSPQFMFQFVTQAVSDFLKPGSSVNKMYAGLNILCCAAEGCKAQYQERLEDIVGQFILPYVHDSQYHPKVRYAALTALGQLFSDFGNILVSRIFDDVLDAYSKALLNSSSERVQCHAFAALNNFFESASKIYIPKAVNRLSPTFATFLQQKFSQKTIMAFFSTIIPFAENEIDSTHLYSAIHGQLMEIINSTSNHKDHLPIHSKAVLVIFSLGQFADGDLFKNDIHILMNNLIKMMQSPNIESLMSNIGYDDYLLSWQILIKKLPNESKQFLEFILSKVYLIIETVKKSELNFFDENSFKDADEMNKAIHLQSLQSSDAIMSLRLLSTISEVYSKDVGSYMEKFVEPISHFFDEHNIMLLDHAYSALASIILTLNEAKLAETWPRLIQITINFDSETVDSDSFLRIMSSFMGVAEALGPKSLDENFIKDFISKVIVDVLECQHKDSTKAARLNYYRENEDFEEYDMLDDGYLHGEDNEEQSYLEGVIVFTRAMFSLFGKRFEQYFELYKDSILAYLKPDNPFTEVDINYALNLWISILEQAPLDVIEDYLPQITNDLSLYISDKRHILVHTSSYGYGLVAEKIQSNIADNFLSKHLSYAAGLLENHKKSGAALSGELSYHIALENVVSALIRILRFKPHLTGNMKMQLTSVILDFLPFEHDIEELPNCFNFVSSLILSTFDDVDQIPPEMLQKILKIQLDSFLLARQIVTPEVLEMVGKSLIKLKTGRRNLDTIIKNLGEEYEAVYTNLAFS